MIIETLYTMLDSLCFRRFLLQSYVNFGIIVEFGYGKEPQPFIILFKNYMYKARAFRRKT